MLGVISQENKKMPGPEMQLFIITVTYEFLYIDNYERRVELPFAREYKIPALTIPQETSLTAEFSKKCRNLQDLDKSLTDPISIAYGLKLKKFLENCVADS